MILDSSVILCTIQRELGWEGHSRILQAAEHLLISAGTLQEQQLNDGDCFAAALAREWLLPLALQGHEFAAAGY
jgi:uncharacterized protein with PIN domain